MWMSDYVRAVKRKLRDQYGFKPNGGTNDDPTFDSVPDGEYPMKIDRKLDRVRIVDGKFQLCNFEEPKPKARRSARKES